MAPTDQAVVADAGPLIHLDEWACLDLLADFGKVIVPDAVWREVKRHRPGSWRGKRSVNPLPWCRP